MPELAWFIGGILLLLSAIHLYWLFGGQWGMHAVIPSQDGQAAFRPSRFGTAIVAVLLAAAGRFVLEVGAVVTPLYPAWLLHHGGWLLAAVFMLRVIGDFRLVGLFKKVKDSRFARWDARLYIPLCLIIAIGVGVLTAYA